MKLLVLIFSCKKYLSRINKLKSIGYLDSFDKKNINYLIIIGDEKINEEYILDNIILKLRIDDSYKGYPYKVIKTYNLIYNLYDYDYIIKTDDDCLLNIEKIQKNFDYIKKYDYIGRLNNFKEQYNPNYKGLNNKSEYLGPYMNGATGYVLSKQAIETIVNYKEQTNKLLLNELYEDKLIGDILRLNGYKFKEHDLWKSIGIELNEIYSMKELLEKPYISFYQFQ